MNPHEPAAPAAALPPAPGGRKLKVAALIFAGVAMGVAIAYGALRYFTYCGDCKDSPIICSDPCELPTFSELLAPGATLRARA
jgi:hypothetical protein